VAWSFGSRLVSAVLQMVALVLLARGLEPARYAVVSSVYVAMSVTAEINGFGLLRQIELRRSRDRADGSLPGLFVLRLCFTYASALLWMLGCLTLWRWTGDRVFLQVVPCAIWLAVEQTTIVWNAIAITDGRNHQLLGSYLCRRLPVVLGLLVALWRHWDVIWVWSLCLAGGSILAYLRGVRLQEPWARVLLPRRRLLGRFDLDFGYWWAAVGIEVRDLDVLALAAVAQPTAGVYAFPARLVRPMNMVTQAVGLASFPVLARRTVVTGRQLTAGVLLGTAPVALVAAVIAVIAPMTVPHLLGQKYADSVQPLQILCLAAVLMGASYLVAVYLQARSKRSTGFAGLTMVLVGIGQVCLVALFGHGGNATAAAWGPVCAQTVLLAMLAIRARWQCAHEALGHAPGPDVHGAI
jgi:O-antigen/teichoic acid export membrane protein